ncbi:MAG: TonB-dependent receptor plug domain-containing protein [Opitutae bacterium]|nr:TonB-dependent receptor plug domain-containing protein [Opitutae bacterium]
MNYLRRRDAIPLAVAALIVSAPLHGQTSASNHGSDSTSAPPRDPAADTPLVLSPFAVTTAKDKGYKATNSTTGTRLDTAIKDVPLSIEVITSEFIRDTASTTLRDSLRFSAGIQLRSQNDYTGNGLTQYQNPGGVNNPEMQTANKTDTTVVIRGFTTDNALRDGFRRKVTTDAANIERIEVVRGPAALLYGIGNFGGVVNYLPKTPPPARQSAAEFTLGTYGLARATFDTGGPLADGRAGYRVNLAAQQNGDYTDFYEVRKIALAAVFTYRPWTNTEFTADLELGRNEADGVGFQSIRARADAIGNDGRLEHAGFIAFPGVSLRTMRWSGPDTFQNSDQANFEFKLTQHLATGLDLLAGYNYSAVTFKTRDVNASVGNNIGPISLWSTLTPVPLDAERGDTDANWAGAPIPHSIVAYSWADTRTRTRAHQARVELNYKLDLFADRPWLAAKNNFLLGAAYERDRTTTALNTLDSANNVYNWKSAADPSPFRFDKQGDGSASLPLRPRHWSEATAREAGAYAIYQGKFLREKIILLGGVRRDRNGVSTRDVGYLYATGAVDAGATSSYSPAQKTYTTTQLGVSFAPIKAVSLYAVRSEGLNPNFSGARDLTGQPMDAVKATNREFGLKFDLFDGRVSGTISHYRITRSGQPNGSFWWAPQTATRRFDPAKPVVYAVTDLNPDAAQRYFYTDNAGASVPLIQWNNNYAYWGDLTRLGGVPAGAAGSTATPAGFQSYRNDGLNAQRDAIQSTWSAAKSAGAVSYWDRNGNAINEAAFAALVAASGPGGGFITLNATKAEGAAYLDAVYGYTRAAGQKHVGSDNWPGWFFNSAPAGTGYNSAAQDTNGFANSPSLSAPEMDRNTGWDGQLLLTPTDDWQVILSFEKNNHEILSLGQFPDYPGQSADRWAPWMFPNGQWGLSGYYSKNEQYTDETKTSTFSFQGLIYPGAQGMDYPKWSWSAFTSYRLAKLGLKGLRVGGGLVRTGPQEYASGFTHGGDALKDNTGLPLILKTAPRSTVSVFAHYDFRFRDRDAFVQLNIDNLLDDQKRYGLLWAPGLSASVKFGATF